MTRLKPKTLKGWLALSDIEWFEKRHMPGVRSELCITKGLPQRAIRPSYVRVEVKILEEPKP